MLRTWRIVKASRVHQAFDGEGARRYGGRWNSPGTSMVYASGSISLAALEVLVHLEAATTALGFKVIPIDFDEALVDELSPNDLPPGWNGLAVSSKTQRIGDDWAANGKHPILQVPSAIIHSEWNYLANPLHPKFQKLRIGSATDFRLDPRLFGAHGN